MKKRGKAQAEAINRAVENTIFSYCTQSGNFQIFRQNFGPSPFSASNFFYEILQLNFFGPQIVPVGFQKGNCAFNRTFWHRQSVCSGRKITVRFPAAFFLLLPYQKSGNLPGFPHPFCELLLQKFLSLALALLFAVMAAQIMLPTVAAIDPQPRDLPYQGWRNLPPTKTRPASPPTAMPHCPAHPEKFPDLHQGHRFRMFRFARLGTLAQIGGVAWKNPVNRY